MTSCWDATHDGTVDSEITPAYILVRYETAVDRGSPLLLLRGSLEARRIAEGLVVVPLICLHICRCVSTQAKFIGSLFYRDTGMLAPFHGIEEK